MHRKSIEFDTPIKLWNEESKLSLEKRLEADLPQHWDLRFHDKKTETAFQSYCDNLIRIHMRTAAPVILAVAFLSFFGTWYRRDRFAGFWLFSTMQLVVRGCTPYLLQQHYPPKIKSGRTGTSLFESLRDVSVLTKQIAAIVFLEIAMTTVSNSARGIFGALPGSIFLASTTGAVLMRPWLYSVIWVVYGQILFLMSGIYYDKSSLCFIALNEASHYVIFSLIACYFAELHLRRTFAMDVFYTQHSDQLNELFKEDDEDAEAEPSPQASLLGNESTFSPRVQSLVQSLKGAKKAKERLKLASARAKLTETENTELKCKVEELARIGQVASTPLDNIIVTLEKLATDSDTEMQRTQLHEVATTLSRRKELLRPIIDPHTFHDLDDQTKAWLASDRLSSDLGVIVGTGGDTDESPKGMLKFNLRSPKGRVGWDSPAIESPYHRALCFHLDDVGLDVDMESLIEPTEGHVLSGVALYILSKRHLIPRLQQRGCPVDTIAIKRFFLEIEELYSDNPYHNQLHAADVLWAAHTFVNMTPFVTFDSLQLFSMVIACAIHDVDHPGTNNGFHIAARTHLATTYNDISILENYHLATGFRVMKRPDCSFALRWEASDYEEFRSLVIRTVLGTDMNQHFAHIGEARDTNLPVPSAMLLLVKLADLSHTFKSEALHTKWSVAICTEFYAQGDLEKCLGLTPKAFTDREADSFVASQLGFLKFVVHPFVEAMLHSFQLPSQLLAAVNSNMEMWKNMESKPESIPEIPVIELTHSLLSRNKSRSASLSRPPSFSLSDNPNSQSV